MDLLRITLKISNGEVTDIALPEREAKRVIKWLETEVIPAVFRAGGRFINNNVVQVSLRDK